MLEDFHRQMRLQIASFFGCDERDDAAIVPARQRADACFLENCSHVRNKYYADPANLSPLQTCQYAMFLHFLSRAVDDAKTKDKLYALIKIVAGMDLYHAVELPTPFFFDHPVGSVLGRARYGRHFMFAQAVTVGNNHGAYPEFGDCVCLNAGAKVLGRCHIGDNVIIAANSYVKDCDIPSDSLVFGSDRNLTVKTGCGERNRVFFRQVFDDIA